MIIPTFVEVMHRFIFSILDKKIIISGKDKELFEKYFWAFELKCLLNNKFLVNEPYKKSS